VKISGKRTKLRKTCDSTGFSPETTVRKIDCKAAKAQALKAKAPRTPAPKSPKGRRAT